MLARLRHRLFAPSLPKTLTSIDAYAQWASSYPPHAHNPLMQAEERAMLTLMPDLAGLTVLDLACGTGRYGLLALERGARFVVGLDNSMAMLNANALPARRVALSTTEAVPLASDSVDVVVCGLALGHLPELKPSLAEISRVLRSRGCALVSDFHPFLFLTGRRRTFTAPDGKTYAVEHYAHLYGDYHRFGCEAGLQIDAILEPGLDSGAKSPIVIVFRLQKSG